MDTGLIHRSARLAGPSSLHIARPSTSRDTPFEPVQPRDKGKGRATSPIDGEMVRKTSYIGKGKSIDSMEKAAMSVLQSPSTPQLLSQSTPRSTDSETPSTPPANQSTQDRSATLPSPWNSCVGADTSLGGVSVDLGDPFTFDPFKHIAEEPRQHIRSSPAPAPTPVALGLRRRPFQSGYATMSAAEEENSSTMTALDRASIFAGLEAAALAPLYSPLTTTNEPAMFSSKRSFDEAISPISSPSAYGRRQTLDRDGLDTRETPPGPSRSIDSSSPHSLDALQGAERGTISASTNSQTVRRRLPHKRRRGASSSRPDQELNSRAVSSSTTVDSSIAAHEDCETSEDFSFPRGYHEYVSQMQASSTRAPSPLLSSSATTAERAVAGSHSSVDSNVQAMFDGETLPPSTSQLLQQWWADMDTAASSFSNTDSDRSTLAEAGSERTSLDRHLRWSEATTLSSSGRDQHGAHGTLPTLGTAILQQTDDEEGHGQDNESRGMQYHSQLLNVLRRLNRGMDNSETGETEQIRPRPPLRSLTMHRSTTQLDQTARTASTQRQLGDITQPNTAEADLRGRLPSHTTALEDISSTRPTLLPSARSVESSRSRLRMLQSRLEDLSSQRPHGLSYREVVGRNDAIRSSLAERDPLSRARHAGSPTFPIGDDDVESNRQSISSHQHRQSGGEYGEQSHPTPLRQSTTITSPSNAPFSDVEMGGNPLWGEYRHTPSSHHTLQERASTATMTADDDFASGAASSQTSGYSSSARRRIGALDSSGRLRGPTRRLNAHWLGMQDDLETSGFEVNNPTSSSRPSASSPMHLDEEERVMSTYRRMLFPDPEATIPLAEARHEEISDSINEPPRLPSLRSRSPLQLSFGRASERFVDGAQDQTNEEALSRNPRPSLRPLTLSSRAATASSLSPISSLTRRTPLRDSFQDQPGQNSASSHSSVRVPDSGTAYGMTDASDQAAFRTGSRRLRLPLDQEHQFYSSPFSLDAHRRYRTLRLARERDARLTDGLDHPRSDRSRRTQQNTEEERSANAGSVIIEHTPVDYSLDRTLRQLSSVGVHARRRPTLLDADSSASDMNDSSSTRYGLQALPWRRPEESLTQHRGENVSTETAAEARTRLGSSSSSYHTMRSSSRWDRYLDEVGTSAGFRSFFDTQAQDEPSSSSSSSSLHSLLYGTRLPGTSSSFGATLRSEIAANAGNYLTDDDFALRDSYEGLLHLSSQIGDVRSKSTPTHIIAKLPTCQYSHWLGGSCQTTKVNQSTIHERIPSLAGNGKGKGKAQEGGGERPWANNKDTSCSICLDNYQEMDSVMSLPCNHAFHETCLTSWLKTAHTCPCCRGDVCGEEGTDTHCTNQATFWHRILPELAF